MSQTVETPDTSQEVQLRVETTGAEALRDIDCVLRIPHLPESVESQPTADDTMIINMGPQHPSTHGVLRVMMELDGETVLRAKPVIGYLHTGMEKQGEELTYLQGPTNVTRMDYVSPMFNELVFALATE
ncbi:MAG TPA: NADH-quinone oxidoreductase subunit D, partial [Acidimicrobiales bacterium]|nr:NADH-quinone oxidoreductase subunit D [Acidimicrobiales bacterium]